MTEDDIPDLPNLVGLCLGALGLKVQDLRDALSREDVVATLDSLVESQVSKQTAERRERDVGVRGPLQDLREELAPRGHALSLSDSHAASARPVVLDRGDGPIVAAAEEARGRRVRRTLLAEES